MDARLTPRRLLSLVAIAAAVASTSACGGGSSGRQDPPAAQPAPLVKYANDYLTFRHPSTWKAYPFRWSGALHFQPMLYVSTQPVQDPCRTSGNTTTCKWPVRRLRPDGVLIAWENRGFPGWSLRTQPGQAIRVGGRAAKRAAVRPGPCAAIGGDETVEIAIARPMASNWTEATACVRGPHLAQNERRLTALLASTRFRTS